MPVEPLKKIALLFYKSLSGNEPVRDWLKELPEAERHAIGHDLMRLQWRWPDNGKRTWRNERSSDKFQPRRLSQGGRHL
jgi:hypothetical protein